MPILNFKVEQVGQAGVFPAIIYILTDDTLAEVTATGYLNGIARGNTPLSEADMALVTTKTSPNAQSTQVAWLEVSKSGENWSLVPTGSPGSVTLPTKANHIATYTNTLGNLSEDPTNAISGGNIQAGISGTSGWFASFPPTAARGSLHFVAADNIGDTVTQIINQPMNQPTLLTIPDPGTSTAEFLINNGPSNIIDYQQFVGLDSIILISTGTWTTTRLADSDYAKVHTPAAETSIIAMDITPWIRTDLLTKGFRLNSFNLIYSIGTQAMVSHSAILSRVEYANNVAVAVFFEGISSSLATAVQANPYVTSTVLTSPHFHTTPNSKYFIEVTTNNAATTAYKFYGVVLNFSQTIA